MDYKIEIIVITPDFETKLGFTIQKKNLDT